MKVVCHLKLFVPTPFSVEVIEKLILQTKEKKLVVKP